MSDYIKHDPTWTPDADDEWDTDWSHTSLSASVQIIADQNANGLRKRQKVAAILGGLLLAAATAYSGVGLLMAEKEEVAVTTYGRLPAVQNAWEALEYVLGREEVRRMDTGRELLGMEVGKKGTLKWRGKSANDPAEQWRYNGTIESKVDADPKKGPHWVFRTAATDGVFYINDKGQVWCWVGSLSDGEYGWDPNSALVDEWGEIPSNARAVAQTVGRAP